MTDTAFVRSGERGGGDDDPLRLLVERLQHLGAMVSALPEVAHLDAHGHAPTADGDASPERDGGALDEIEQALDALEDHAGGAVADALAQLDTAAGEVVGALTEEGEAVRDADEALATHGGGARGSIASLVDRVQGDEEVVDGAHDEAQDAVQALSAEASDEHLGSTRDVFERAGETLSARCLEAVDEGFDALGQHADRSFDALHESVQGASDGWSRAIGHLLAESGQEVTQTFLRELREGIDGLIREGVQAIIEELAEQAASMAAGASTTAALGPLMPELIAAKRALHAANAIADLLGLD